MEGTEEWVLHPHRCQVCSHATYLRECWRDCNGIAHRHLRHEPLPSLVQVQSVQLGTWLDDGGLPVAVLPTSGGISYTVRGHGVTVTVCGHANDVLNIARVALDVVSNPVISGQVCIRHSPGQGVGGGAFLQVETETENIYQGA
nr:MAG: putative silencing suppressor protein [Tombusviridae sp.]